ncbi:hypothetical protein FRC12_002129 [Ceratobasidium sp. 428]|nr:hypothetical protein FRC12_002129 [Ceratobasidium sp. 428]
MDRHPLYRVISILELLRLIYSLLQKKDHINLMSISRRAFTYVAPMLWEDVDLQHLLLLIPGASVRTHHIDIANAFGPSILYSTFNFPIAFDLSRFKLYSSSVRVLRSAAPYSVNFPDDLPSPDSQSSMAHLLPNLERLLVHAHSHAKPYLSWVHRFLVPNLREFRLLPIRAFEEDIEDPELHPESDLELANKVIASCPRIEVLDIHAWEPNARCKSKDHPFPYRYYRHQQRYIRDPEDLWERLFLLG